MKILAIDTAGPVIGVCLGDEVRTERITRGAETRLVPWIAALTGGSPPDGIAVAVGPGTFTGVRVGIATAQGLAMAWGIPLVGVGSLRSRGRAAGATLCLLDARKQRFYAGWSAEDYSPTDRALDAILAHGRAAGYLVDGWTATGEGAEVARAVLEAAGATVHPRATDPALRELAMLGREALEAGPPWPGATPLYVRAPDATPPRCGP